MNRKTCTLVGAAVGLLLFLALALLPSLLYGGEYLLVEATIYDKFLAQLIKEGGHLASPEEKQKLQAALWDAEGHRMPDTVAISADRKSVV